MGDKPGGNCFCRWRQREQLLQATFITKVLVVAMLWKACTSGHGRCRAKTVYWQQGRSLAPSLEEISRSTLCEAEGSEVQMWSAKRQAPLMDDGQESVEGSIWSRNMQRNRSSWKKYAEEQQQLQEICRGTSSSWLTRESQYPPLITKRS